MANRHSGVFFEVEYWVPGAADTSQETRYERSIARVRKALVAEGKLPISIKEKTQHWWQKEIVGGDYKINFLKAIAFHVEGGASAGMALRIVIDGEEHVAKRLLCEPALQVIEAGGSFSEALDRLGFFPDAVIALLKAGEESSQLGVSTASAVSYMEDKRSGWKLLISAMTWVAFDLFMAVSTVISIQWWYLPMVEKQGPQDATNPELAEKFAHAISMSYKINGALLGITFIGCAIILGAIITVIASPALRRQIERMAAKVPLLRGVILDGAMSDTYSIVGRMTEGHVNILASASVAAKATPFRLVKDYWMDVANRLKFGDALERAMTRSDLVTRDEAVQIKAHQSKSQFARVLLSMSKHRQEKHKTGTRLLILTVTIISMAYAAIAALLTLWISWVQYGSTMSNMGLSSGGF